MNFSLLSLFLFFLLSTKGYGSSDIKVYKIEQCDSNAYYSVTVSDVHFEIKNSYVYVNGSLTSDYTINSPVKAALEVKFYMKALNVWVTIPCVENIGSCPFTDLCTFGLPVNKKCPERFQKDNVPCRCPIPEGTYHMDSENQIQLFKIPDKITYNTLSSESSQGNARSLSSKLLTGTYYITATITERGSMLSCYKFYLDYEAEMSNSVEVEPIVQLVL